MHTFLQNRWRAL